MSKIKAKFTLNPNSKINKDLTAISRLNTIMGRLWFFKWSFLVAGLLLTLITVLHQRDVENIVFLKAASQTRAQVLSCTMQGGGYREAKVTLIDYSYEVDGLGYQITTRLVDNRWYCDDYPVGNWYPAFYSPSTPQKAYFDGRMLTLVNVGTVYIGVFLCVVLCALTTTSWKSMKIMNYKQAHLEQGILVEGEITDVDGGKHTEMVTVYYEFYTPEQKHLVGQTSAYRPDLKGHLPSVGTPILVLYINDRTHQAV